jgi:hypothetical protein
LSIALVGGVIGSVIFLAVALGAFLYLLRSYRRKKRGKSVQVKISMIKRFQFIRRL